MLLLACDATAHPPGPLGLEVGVKDLKKPFVILIREVDLDPGPINKNAVRGDLRRLFSGQVVHICRNYLLRHAKDDTAT